MKEVQKALSVLTQPYLFNGSPDYFIQVRKAVDVPMLMKDIMIDHVQIDAAKKIGADYMLVIQSLLIKNFLLILMISLHMDINKV